MQLLEYLLQNYKDLSRNKLKSMLTRGAVLVDGKKRTRHDFPVTETSRIELLRGQSVVISNAERNMRRFATIEYEDRWIIIINKKNGVLSVPSGHHGFCLKTLLDSYLQRKGEKCTAHVIHRLDKETSGLMIFAKSREIQDIFTHNWHDIIEDRRYYALSSGIPQQKRGTIESYLLDDRFYHTHSSKEDNGGKYAITHYNTLHTMGNYALLDVKLETGRKNQIRVHLQDIGCSVVGDYKYGNEDDPIHRLGLHAYRLCFTHPVTHQPMSFETPLPTSFFNFLEI